MMTFCHGKGGFLSIEAGFMPSLFVQYLFAITAQLILPEIALILTQPRSLSRAISSLTSSPHPQGFRHGAPRLRSATPPFARDVEEIGSPQSDRIAQLSGYFFRESCPGMGTGRITVSCLPSDTNHSQMDLRKQGAAGIPSRKPTL